MCDVPHLIDRCSLSSVTFTRIQTARHRRVKERDLDITIGSRGEVTESFGGGPDFTAKKDHDVNQPYDRHGHNGHPLCQYWWRGHLRRHLPQWHSGSYSGDAVAVRRLRAMAPTSQIGSAARRIVVCVQAIKTLRKPCIAAAPGGDTVLLNAMGRASKNLSFGHAKCMARGGPIRFWPST